jgi:predicted MFS family arabinose efflux permease
VTHVPAGPASQAGPAGGAGGAEEGPAAGSPRDAGSWAAILAGRRGRLLVGLLLTELVVAVQILIVITLLPAIVRDIGGIRLYGLALSVAALAGIGAAPIAVRLLDRWGARVVVPAGAVLFAIGALGAGLAQQMTELVAARFLEGAGASALEAIAISSVAVLYAGAERPKAMALGQLAWLIPAAAGPAVGSLALATVGWRWAFTASLLPLAVAMLLAGPNLGLLRPSDDRPERGVTGPSLLLLAGLLAVVAGPTEGGPAGIVLAVAGAVLAAGAVRRIMPKGTLTMRPGLPVATMAMFCCSFAFFAVDGFVPLLLTAVDGRSVSAAGIVVTVAVLGWTAGGMIQARLARRGWTPARLLGTGGVLLLAGIAGTAGGLIPAAWLVPYLAWGVGAFGMGLAYTGTWLAAMDARAGPATGLAGPLVADRVGTALGAGVGGVCVAVAAGAGLGISGGIGIGLAVAAAGACAVTVAARRMI